MLKVGLIGCGGMGSIHAECWLALKGKVKIAAIADTIPEKANKYAEKCGAKVYLTGDELLKNEELDIVDVCVPTYLHTKYAVDAMKKGCHVFIEKPICLNEEEAKILLETQKETGVKVQVGQVIRFWDEYCWVRDAYKSGKYGEIISGVFQRLSSNPKWSWDNWYNDPERSGTMALDLHVHDVDYVRYLLGGEPDSVMSQATRNKDGVLEQIFTNYTYGDAVITVEGCWDYPSDFPFAMNFRIKFEKATAEYFGGKLTVYDVEGGKFEPEFNNESDADVDTGINVSGLGPYGNEIRYFVNEIINGNGPEIAPLSEAIESVRLAWKEIEIAGGKVSE